MLTRAVERYIGLRHATGFKFDKPARQLRSFAEFAAAKGDTHVKTVTAVEWAASGGTPGQRGTRLRAVVRFALQLKAEDPAHEIPPAGVFVVPSNRPTPYIYTPDEIARILEAAGQLRRSMITPLRVELYQTLFGLIAATGLRVGEALRLRFDDLLPGGILRIRKTKFGKSRLVPLHPTVVAALDQYLALRRRINTRNPHLFLGGGAEPLHWRCAESTFTVLLKRAGIAPDRSRRPRIHDLRHSSGSRIIPATDGGCGYFPEDHAICGALMAA
jgi:integrase/recombinase XerD